MMNGIRPEPTPIDSREKLKTLPVGFYSIPSEEKIVPAMIGIRNLAKYENCPVVPMARILDEIPTHLQDGMGVYVSVSGRRQGSPVLG